MVNKTKENKAKVVGEHLLLLNKVLVTTEYPIILGLDQYSHNMRVSKCT